MAEKKTKEAPAPPKRSREIKDAGQRIVFAGLTMDSQKVAGMLVESMKLPPLPGVPAPDEKAKKKELEQALELLDVEDGGAVTVWVRVGGIVVGINGEAVTKADAVEQAVDKPLGRQAPGRFRAPTVTHWRGEKRRTPPSAVPLDEEDVD